MTLLFSRSGLQLLANAVDTQGKYFRLQDRPCVRCGGAGGAEAWRHTGWTCYRCQGTGRDPVKERVKLYTRERLDQLIERKAKADAKRAVIKAEKDRLEAERREADKAEMISNYANLLGRIAAELEQGSNDILESVRDCITERVKDPSDRQLEVAEKILTERAAERVRLAAARHIGQIKERREFTLTLLHYQCSKGELPNGIVVDRHWSLFADENDCRIACKSAPWLLGLKRVYDRERGIDGEYERGQTVKVKATVVEHTHNGKGEPITYINRPKEA